MSNFFDGPAHHHADRDKQATGLPGRIETLTRSLDALSYGSVVALSLLLIAGVGVVDYLTGPEIRFGAAYNIPVALAAWRLSYRSTIVVVAVSTGVWLVAETLYGGTYSHFLVPLWNGLSRFCITAVLAVLVAAVRVGLHRERLLRRTDSLTGVLTRHAFYELARAELQRLDRYRHVFSIAYIDVDNFKAVNDTFGHSTGDRVLQAVAATLMANTRLTDAAGRLGGDEFAILMPGTDEEAAWAATQRLRQRLLEEPELRELQVTLSIGLLTCLAPPRSADELIQMADTLMYTVKKAGKDAVEHAVLAHPHVE